MKKKLIVVSLTTKFRQTSSAALSNCCEISRLYNIKNTRTYMTRDKEILSYIIRIELGTVHLQDLLI